MATSDQYEGLFNTGSLTDGGAQLPSYLAQAMRGFQTGYPDQSGLPSYLAAAMADPSLTPPQTPVAQAMAPQAQPPMLTPQGSQGPQMSPIQAMFQHQATDPRMALNNSLLAAGSALMGGENLQKGLAGAGAAFNDTFDKTLDNQRRLNTPQVTPLADGSFSMVQLPGQGPQVMPNDQVQNFLLGRVQMQSQAGLAKAIMLQQMKQQGQEAQQARATAIEAGPKAMQADQTLHTMQQALDIVTKGRSWQERAAAFSPTVGGAAGYGSQNQILARVGVDSQLAQGAVKAGVVTQGMFDKFETDIPKSTDSDAVWKSFLERNMPFVQKISDYQHSLVNAGAQKGGGISQAAEGVLGSHGAASASPIRGNGASYIQ